jgi:putative aminopeptidase FrvX
MIELTQELILARGPSGQEDDVRKIVQREMAELCDEVKVDDAENVIGLVRGGGAKGKSKAPVINVMAHMDELAMIVKRIEDNGTLRVRAVGGLFPWAIGLGPVEIMADCGVLPGVLSVGPMHSTLESPAVWRAKPVGENRGLEWPQVYIFTRMTRRQLDEAGVHAGTRVVVAQSRRKLLPLGDCIGGYFLDDRVCIAIMLGAISMLRTQKKRPAGDVNLVATCVEEIGGGGAPYAAGKLGGGVTLAIDVGPVAPEFGTQLNAEPIVVYRDDRGLYNKSVSDRLLNVGKQLGLKPQAAMWEGYGSDASMSRQTGQTPAAALLCIPTENTHAYEIVPKAAIENCARLLAGYLEAPVG